MRTSFPLIVSLLFAAALRAPSFAAAPSGEDTARSVSPSNIAEEERNEALKLKGSAQRGKDIYEICEACHGRSGAGRPDGTIPQLAGQHTAVLIKQMADIRAGLRDNPKMYPYAIQLTDPRDLADVAAYIESLCIPADHGKYQGADLAKQLAAGKDLYDKECRTCHGANGEGDGDRFYPVIAGQHYKYLLRQMTEIRAGKRRNANAEMVGLIRKYDDRQLVALAAYQASFSMPGRVCQTGTPKPRRAAAATRAP